MMGRMNGLILVNLKKTTGDLRREQVPIKYIPARISRSLPRLLRLCFSTFLIKNYQSLALSLLSRLSFPSLCSRSL